MKIAHALASLSILAAATFILPACTVRVDRFTDDAAITCDAFDSYLFDCYPSCAVTWDCEYFYDILDFDTQLLLDDCADCLVSVSFSCSDCSAGGASCHALLSSYLGISCTW